MTAFLGQDLSGLATDLPIGQRPSETGVGYFATDWNRAFVSNNTIANNSQGWMVPTDGKVVYSASAPRYLFDNFYYLDTTTWDIVSGSDAQALDAALVAGSEATIGEVILTSGNAGTGIAADGSVMASPLVFEAEEGEIHAIWKAKISNASDIWFYLGFTDVLPSTTLEQPFSLATTTYTSTCSNGCGFLYDTAATTDTIRIVGVKGDTDATHVDTSVAPGTSYREYKLVINTDGDCTGYIDGTAYTTVEDAVTPGTDLCFFAGVNARTTTTKTLTLDYSGAK